MDVTSLPELVMEVLINFLTEHDVLRCCMVSRSWREALNLDRYWRVLCLRRHQQSLFKYLKERACQVDPKFKEPNESSSLQAPCKWKINYIRARHLVRNREKGQYIVHDLKNRTRAFHLNADIVYFHVDDEVEFWNVSAEPFLQSRLNSLSYPSTISLCKLTRDLQTLVIIQQNVLQVFGLSGSDYCLLYRRLLNKPEDPLAMIPNTEGINSWLAYNDPDWHHCTIKGEVFENFFICVYVYRNKGNVILCVWNLKTAVQEDKLDLYEIPGRFVLITLAIEVLQSSSLKYMIIKIDYFDDLQRKRVMVFLYNLKSVKRIILPSRITFLDVISVINGGLGAVCLEDTYLNRNLQFYDICSEKPILLTSLPVVGHLTCRVHEPYFMYCLEAHRNNKTIATIATRHTKTLLELSFFNIEFEMHNMRVSLELLHDNIMGICCHNISTIWDWKKQIKLYALPPTYYMPIYKDDNFTYLCVGRRVSLGCHELNIYHFW